MEKILEELSLEARKKILEIKKQDEELYFTILKKIIRLKTIIKTGNIKIWKKIKKEEEDLFQIILGEFSRQDKVKELRKKIIEI